MGPVPARAAAVQDAPDPESPPAGTERVDRERTPWWLVAALVALVALPLVVAAVALHRPRWFPVLDLAMTELRVRDVGGRHTPLIGLPGRIGAGNLLEQGSHPGPLSFYLLAPTYRLLGSSPWALQVGAVVLNVVAAAVALLVAARRGAARLVLAVGAVLAVLASGYGIATLTEPWNPYLPLLWWLVTLLAVWSVLAGDVAMLPVAVFSGSLAAQTHVPYLGLVGGVGALALAGAVVAWRSHPAGSSLRRATGRWIALALALGVALWVPPLVDQAVNDPGNLQKLVDHFGTPPEEPIGVARGVELALLHLDVAAFVGGDSGANGSLVDASSDPDGSVVPGVVALALWVAAVVLAARHRHGPLLRLHLVVGVALVLGAFSMSRIFGKDWFYLMLWAWVTAALAVIATVWTAGVALAPHLDERRRRLGARAGSAVLVLVAVVASVSLTVDAVDAEPPAENLSATLGALLPPTIAALEREEGPATGRDGRYVVTWTDAYYFGSQGYGLVSELRRAGFDAGAARPFQVPITHHRVVERDEATALVHLATGIFVDDWRQVPGAVEVAYVEPRDADDMERFAQLRRAVIADLRADGLDEVVPIVDANLFGASIDERVSERAQRSMAEMLLLGQRSAIFVAPPGAEL